MANEKTLAILAALPEEEKAVVEAYEARGLRGESRALGKASPLQVIQINAPGVRVVVARSGVGSVNGALTLLRLWQSIPDLSEAWLLGVGGALVEGLTSGSLIVASAVVQHDSFASLEEGNFLMQPGSYLLTAEEGRKHQPKMECSAPSLAPLCERLKQANLSIPVESALLASGGEFVGTASRKRALAKAALGSKLVDMEAAGFAQAATQLGIPFGVAKTVADELLPDDNISADFLRTLKSASANAAHVATALVDLLGTGQSQ